MKRKTEASRSGLTPSFGVCRKALSIVLALSLLAALFNQASARSAGDYSAAIDPNTILVDNFEGWGTSLCWWANVIGGYANRTNYADLAFGYLKINIVRYNIGGGENPGISNTMEFRARMPGFEPGPGVWNWNADANQRWMLRAARDRGANRIEAFANSPPYWMTASGSVTGSTNGTSNNLQTNYEGSFAVYLAEVVKNISTLDAVTFHTVTPMNEPSGTWWKYGGRQEGDFMSRDQQNRMLNLLRLELDNRGLATGLDASEDNDEQSAINSVNSYDASARNHLTQMSTHTYNPNNPTGVRDLAATVDRPLWVSEYGDGDATGMQTARRIRDDIAVMKAKAWVYWQVVDNAGGWGMLLNPMDNTGNINYSFNRKFYIFAQFSRFIRPGHRLISSGDTNSLVAYDPVTENLTIVTVNDSSNAFNATFDLSAFILTGSSAQKYRTSSGETLAALPAVAITNKQFTASFPAQSVTTHVIADVLPGPPPLMVNDNTTGSNVNQFQYAGSWSYYNAQSGAYQNDNHWSSTLNDNYQVRFDGTQIRLLAARAPNHGIGAVSIDGGAETLVDFYAAARADGSLVYTSPVLAGGTHILKMRVTATKNAASSGTYVPADRVDILTPNLAANPGFELDGAAVRTPAGWQESSSNNLFNAAAYTETLTPHSGLYRATHWSAAPYAVRTFQTITNLPDGSYTLTAWIRSGGGQNAAWMEARDYGGALMTANIPASANWRQISITNIAVTAGSCTIGFYSDAGANQWINFDDVDFELAGPPGPPALSMAAAAGALSFHWPAWATTYGLQSAATPASSPWFPATATPLLTNGQWNVVLPLPTIGNRFYRLSGH